MIFKLVPGGQSIGVQLHTLGVLVVGHHLVNGIEGGESSRRNAKYKCWRCYFED